MIRNKVNLRPATLKDADFLFKCRNDPQTREASHNTEEISLSEHLSWLERSLKNPDCIIMIAEKKGLLIGTVRASIVDGVYVLSWALIPSARGHGLAKEMVAIFVGQIKAAVRAEVKAGNYASMRIAEYSGMKKIKEVNGVTYYERESGKT